MPKQVDVSYEGQTFQITYLFEEILDYTNNVLGDENANKETMYHSAIVEPIIEMTDSDSLGNSFFSEPKAKVEKVKNNTIEMKENLEAINNIVKEILIHSAENLPGHDIQVFIMPMDPNDHFAIYNMEGVSGITSFSGDVMIIEIDPGFNKEMLEYALAHEYHHTVAIKEQREFTESVLDMVLLEGKADTFANMLYPKVDVPWTEPLSDEEMDIVLQAVKENPFDSDIPSELQYGTGEYPTWANYRLGYAIMESYMNENKDIPLVEWTTFSSEEIVNASEYSHLLNGM